jgi:hypothetical protein
MTTTCGKGVRGNEVAQPINTMTTMDSATRAKY